MQFWVGITDGDWYTQLAAERPDEVNFWRPGGTRRFRSIAPGSPFFLGESEWIPVPEDWAPNIVTGKTYDTARSPGATLWERVGAAMRRQESPVAKEMPVPRDVDDRAGSVYLAHARLGQGAFRVLVTDAYARKCAITGERTLPVLEAAHIKPHALSGPNRVDNGLLLRSDLHILFDRGYLTIAPDYRIEVSQRIREEYENGRDYYALSGKPLATLPEREGERPRDDFIAWHNENVYLG